MRVLPVLLVALLLAGCSAPAAQQDDPVPMTTVVAPPAGKGPDALPTETVIESPTGEPIRATLPRYGVTVSPQSFDGEEFAFFFRQAEDTGGIVLWGGDAEVLADSQGAADVVAALAEQHDLRFGAQVGFYEPGVAFDTGRQSKAAFDVLSFVERTQPDLLVLGVEVDRIGDAAFLEAFATWYASTYAEVKRASPDTLVFPSFQLEHVKGFTGGLFGGPEKSPELWHVVDMFPDRDLTAFTTYPGLLYSGPGSIPADYYTSIADHVDGDIAFTEIGWQAGTYGPGFESSPDEQRVFLSRFLDDTKLVEPVFSLWLHLYDQPQVSPEPFRTMGLADASGAKRPAYDAWVAAVAAG